MARTFKLKTTRAAADVDFDGALNAAQLAVATASGGPMLVIAGAGSGETRSLTYRLAWLLREGADPSRILLVTFTNRAAREMVHRVEQLVRADAHRIWCGTFHHVANRMLRQHADQAGLSPDFTILDREDAGDLLASCVSDAGVRIETVRFPGKNVLLAINSFIANTLEPLAEVVQKRYPMFVRHTERIGEVLGLYADRKRHRQLLDYDDLLIKWRELLEKDAEAGGALADRFDHILVDEYQDTNALQGDIVDRLAVRHRNVCVVGDDSQSIYSFRGANFANIMRFTDRYPDAQTFKLEDNYRSTPEILELANASIAHNTERLPKTLRPVRPSSLKPAVVPCGDHFVQSRFIAEYILHLLDSGRTLWDIAVLYRSHWHAMEIQMELQRRDVPFQVRGGLRFFEQAHIKDVLGFVRLHHNGHDELAWQRLLRLLPRIGGALAKTVWDNIASAEDPLVAAADPATTMALPPRARASFKSFVDILQRTAAVDSPAEMIAALMDGFYDDFLVGHYDNAALRRQDIDGVAEFATQYATIEAFLSDVALTGDFDGETCEDGPDEQEFITLSTVHQAKGLEWPVVLIPWVSDGRFPTDLAMGSNEDLEEERRVFHVAVTRAKDELYLIVPQVWSNHQQHRIIMKPSRFLTELEDEAGNAMPLTETMYLEDDLPDTTSGKS